MFKINRKSTAIIISVIFIVAIIIVKLGTFEFIIGEYQSYKFRRDYWKKRTNVQPYQDGHLMVVFKNGTATSTIKEINQKFGAEILDMFQLGGFGGAPIEKYYYIKIPVNNASNTTYFLQEYDKLPQVELVNYNWRQ